MQNKQTKTILYIGLNDKDTKRQEVATVEAYKLVQNVIVKLAGGGTIYEASGIYTHDNGDIVIEKTLRVELFNIGQKTALDICEILKTALNQESIILQTEIITSQFI